MVRVVEAVVVVGRIAGRVRQLGRTGGFAAVASRVAPKVDRAVRTATGGRVASVGAGLLPTLTLTTIGRRSGQERTVQVLCHRAEGMVLVTASNWGKPTHPVWSANLLADPWARVQISGEVRECRARLLTGAEKNRVWHRLLENWPGYDNYEARSGRDLRVFSLEPDPPIPAGEASAWRETRTSRTGRDDKAHKPGTTNWFGNIDLEAGVVAEPVTVDEIVEIVRDHDHYPSPVRAAGSSHSTTRCGVADGGTVVSLRKMNRITHIGDDTVTAQAGALYIDVAKALHARGLQFYVNVEIGNMTIGSAACGGTKDASMPGELGQVCSYVAGMKMVTASGEIVEITEDEPDLLQAARSSYGLWGVVFEVTFKVKPLLPMVVRHERYPLADFLAQLPTLKAKGESMMLFIDPFVDQVIVEYRRYQPAGTVGNVTRWQWTARNLVWSKLGPYGSYQVTNRVPWPHARHWLLGAYYRFWYVALGVGVRGHRTYATDQMIRYPETSNNCRYTFSIWAFPDASYAETLAAYHRWVNDYHRRTGFRADVLHVGYRIDRDTNNLFSYSFDGPVMTIDPVSTGNEGWDEFLLAYNQWCSDHDGVPLFNQTHGLTRAQVGKAFGDRLATFAKYREQFDPDDRFLNRYFGELLT